VFFVILLWFLDLKEFEFSFEKISLLILVIIQFGVVFALFLSYFYDVAPMGMSKVRIYYYTESSVRTALFVALQQLFMVSIFLNYKSNYLFRNSVRPVNDVFVFFSLLGLLLSSYFANRSGTIITGGYGADFKEVMWGGWSLLYVLCASVLLYQSLLYKRISIISVLSLSVLYWLLHANRGEVFVLAFLLGLILLLPLKGKVLSVSKAIFYFFVLVTFYLFFEVVGDARSVGISEYDFAFGFVEGGVLSISTIGSAAWSLISSINIADASGYMYGSTFLNYFTRVLPSFIPVPWEVSVDIAKYTSEAYTRGGSGFAGEAYINFGVFGPSAIAYIFVYFLRYLLSKGSSSPIYACFFLVIVLYSPRLIFYGYIYLVKALFLFLGILLLSRAFAFGNISFVFGKAK